MNISRASILLRVNILVFKPSSSDPQNDGISGAIIPKGATLFGQFTAVQLSGKAVLYKYDT